MSLMSVVCPVPLALGVRRVYQGPEQLTGRTRRRNKENHSNSSAFILMHFPPKRMQHVKLARFLNHDQEIAC